MGTLTLQRWKLITRCQALPPGHRSYPFDSRTDPSQVSYQVALLSL
ncbi:magnesium chelatase [Corchorus olitorius]|uniref:Magnesium chelatase n=1 Tax=Corchorus olitorius TaxID=93759 RepID=A0A1R3I643_9ROSI|nr:magnesium chelatase [Corchorus olitorius]